MSKRFQGESTGDDISGLYKRPAVAWHPFNMYQILICTYFLNVYNLIVGMAVLYVFLMATRGKFVCR